MTSGNILGGDMTIKTQVSMSTIVHVEMSEYVRVSTYGIESAPPSSYPPLLQYNMKGDKYIAVELLVIVYTPILCFHILRRLTVPTSGQLSAYQR